MNGQLDDAVIQAGRLSKAYKGMPVLQGPTLRVPRHSIFGFLGPDGAGKGTTIRLLLGRIRPSGGRASGFDCDIGRDRVAIRRRVG